LQLKDRETRCQILECVHCRALRQRKKALHLAGKAVEITLVRAMRRRRYAVSELPPGLRPPVLKAYLDRFAGEVQRLFPVPKGSAVDAFEDLAPRYPVFELQLLKDTAAASP